MGIFFCLCP